MLVIGCSGANCCLAETSLNTCTVLLSPAWAILRAAIAALFNASMLMASEYEKPVFSPDTARTPTPRSIL